MHAEVDAADALDEGQADPEEPELAVGDEQADAQGHREGGVIADEGEVAVAQPRFEYVESVVLDERPGPGHQLTQRDVHDQC